MALLREDSAPCPHLPSLRTRGNMLRKTLYRPRN